MKLIIVSILMFFSAANSWATMAPGFEQEPMSESTERTNHDAKMGADAAASGTDIHDEDIQAEEERQDPQPSKIKSPHKKEELQKKMKSN